MFNQRKIFFIDTDTDFSESEALSSLQISGQAKEGSGKFFQSIKLIKENLFFTYFFIDCDNLFIKFL